MLCDICGTKLPDVRSTMRRKIGDVYKDMDLTVECFPGDDVEFDPDAYKKVVGTSAPSSSIDECLEPALSCVLCCLSRSMLD